MEETGVTEENYIPIASHWHTLSHNVVHLARAGFELTRLVVIGTDCIGSYKTVCYIHWLDLIFKILKKTWIFIKCHHSTILKCRKIMTSNQRLSKNTCTDKFILNISHKHLNCLRNYKYHVLLVSVENISIIKSC